MQVASYLGSVVAPDPTGEAFPTWLGATWDRAAVLRYGENPHQQAALYTTRERRPGLALADQLHGKEMSYNNYVDADAAWRAAWDHDEPAVAIIKHTNPCGIAIGADVAEAYGRAFDCDPVSAFGGVVAVNRPLTAEMAAAMAEVFTEVVIAPAYDDEALALLTVKKNVRLLRCDAPAGRGGVELRLVSGGALMQQVDALTAPGDDPAAWTTGVRNARRRGHAARPRLRLARVPRGEVQRDRGGPRGRDRRASAWARSTGSTPRGSRWPGRARSGCAARWRPATRSSRSPTGWRC